MVDKREVEKHLHPISLVMRPEKERKKSPSFLKGERDQERRGGG